MQNLCNSEGKVIGLISLLTIILSFDTEKNDRMMSVHFQDKPFKITVIQVCDTDSNAEEAEVEQFYEDLQDLLDLTHTHTHTHTHTQRCIFHHRGLECRSRNAKVKRYLE